MKLPFLSYAGALPKTYAERDLPTRRGELPRTTSCSRGGRTPPSLASMTGPPHESQLLASPSCESSSRRISPAWPSVRRCHRDGQGCAAPEVRAKLGHYPELGRAAAKAIPHAALVEFTGLGHAPQMQDPDGSHKALLEGRTGGGADESLSVQTAFCPATVPRRNFLAATLWFFADFQGGRLRTGCSRPAAAVRDRGCPIIRAAAPIG